MPGTKCVFDSLRCNVPFPDSRVCYHRDRSITCVVRHRKPRLDPICLDTLRL